MDEGRKRVILIAASILAARKLSAAEIKTGSPAYVFAISQAICDAEAIMRRVDREWPTEEHKRAV